MKNLKKVSLLLALCAIVISSPAVFAQNKPATQIKKYILKQYFPLSIFNNYKMIENTKVIRQYQDSTTMKYEREVTYFFTLRQIENIKDGFLKLHSTVDSLRFKFTEDDATFEFDSQADAQGSLNFDNLDEYLGPLSREFDITYSPYGEVAKIDGGNLDQIRSYVSKAGSSDVDSLQSLFWKDILSDNKLQTIVDIKKLTLPNEPVAKDSTWITKPLMCVNSIYFSDTVRAKLAEAKSTHYTVTAHSDNFKFIPGNYRFYGIKGYLASIDSSNCKADFKLIMNARGEIESFESKMNIDLKAKIKRDVISEKIENTCKWLLMGQFEY